MTEAIIVKVALIIYALFASAALLLTWNNSGSPDAIKNAGLMVASVVPILIVVLPYINQETISYRHNYTLFFDSHQKKIILGDSWNPYAANCMLMFANLSRRPDVMEADTLGSAQEKGLDIIEKGIIEALTINFGQGWNIIMHESHGPTWTIRKRSPSDKPAEGSTIIEGQQLRELFPRNRLVSSDGVLSNPRLVLPPNSKIVAMQKKQYSRAIEIKNKFSRVNLEIFANQGGVEQQGVWGVFEADCRDMNRFYSINYLITLTMKTNRFKRYSPEMASHKQWFENVNKVLSQYDWETIKTTIEKTELRKAIINSVERR